MRSRCDVEGCQEHYACRLRAKGVRLSASACPSRQNKIPPAWTGDNCRWERGRPTTRRPDGTEMPFIKADGNALSVKELSENRPHWDAQIRASQQLAGK